jgi:hypothetical protein
LNRAEAEKALGIIRTVIQNTHEDLVAHNWGQIWMVHAFCNAAACFAGWYVESQELPVFWYLVPLAATAVVNITVVVLLVKRDQGVRSFVEWQIHGIWWTFILFTLAGAVALELSNAPPWLFGPLFAMTSGIGFAMTGVMFSRQFPSAVAFLLVTLVCPLLHRWPGTQWGLIGLTWGCALFFPGLNMYRENQRRSRDASPTHIL